MLHLLPEYHLWRRGPDRRAQVVAPYTRETAGDVYTVGTRQYPGGAEQAPDGVDGGEPRRGSDDGEPYEYGLGELLGELRDPSGESSTELR